MHKSIESENENRSVVSDSLWPHGLHSSWNFPGQNTGVDSLSLLQGILPTQGFNPGLLHCRWILYQLSHQGSPKNTEGNNKSDWCLWACVDFFFSFYFLVVSKFSIKNTFSISRYYFHIGKNKLSQNYIKNQVSDDCSLRDVKLICKKKKKDFEIRKKNSV